ncbi:hypothetical protein [Thalassolituus sp.]|uniref:hypothetical protein n=1 Tax=Thalassolituus sp. TaxID=2030822 RepID=UPI0032D99A4C
MSPIKKYMASLLLIPLHAYAEKIDLVCTNKTNFSVNFEIDTSHNTVIFNGKYARNVFIDNGSISFYIDSQGKEWFHRINRNTGDMAVQSPDKVWLSPYMCQKAKQKF